MLSVPLRPAYTLASRVASFSVHVSVCVFVCVCVCVCGVFVDDSANGRWLLLELDAALDAACGFSEHLHSLRKMKGLQDCSKTLKMGI